MSQRKTYPARRSKTKRCTSFCYSKGRRLPWGRSWADRLRGRTQHLEEIKAEVKRQTSNLLTSRHCKNNVISGFTKENQGEKVLCEENPYLPEPRGAWSDLLKTVGIIWGLSEAPEVQNSRRERSRMESWAESAQTDPAGSLECWGAEDSHGNRRPLWWGRDKVKRSANGQKTYRVKARK